MAAGINPRRCLAGTNCCLPCFSVRCLEMTSDEDAAPSRVEESRYRSAGSSSAG